jgi:hypothetical protein
MLHSFPDKIPEFTIINHQEEFEYVESCSDVLLIKYKLCCNDIYPNAYYDDYGHMCMFGRLCRFEDLTTKETTYTWYDICGNEIKSGNDIESNTGRNNMFMYWSEFKF